MKKREQIIEENEEIRYKEKKNLGVRPRSLVLPGNLANHAFSPFSLHSKNKSKHHHRSLQLGPAAATVNPEQLLSHSRTSINLIYGSQVNMDNSINFSNRRSTHKSRGNSFHASSFNDRNMNLQRSYSENASTLNFDDKIPTQKIKKSSKSTHSHKPDKY